MGSTPTRRIAERLVRSPEEVQRALKLGSAGLNSSQVARLTGIPRTTIRDWFDGRVPRPEAMQRARGCFRCTGDLGPFPRLTRSSYAYLLGIYLGDGYLAQHPRVHRLNVALDSRHPVIAAETAAAMRLAMPMSVATVSRHRVHNLAWVNSYSSHWQCLLPQHGPGPKHLRPIHLTVWQRKITDEFPWRFLRGLVQSDGSRYLNSIRHPRRTYSYPRYEFTNHSDDIRALFTDYCDLVGVQWRQMNQFSVSVARRASVKMMDRHIGPKQ